MANEPVAWHYPDGKPDQCTTDKAYAEKEPAWTPMYYKHEWVGLTRNEILELLNGFYAEGGRSEREIAFARVIQRALKEKNNG